jgi:hypothetical protein
MRVKIDVVRLAECSIRIQIGEGMPCRASTPSSTLSAVDARAGADV